MLKMLSEASLAGNACLFFSVFYKFSPHSLVNGNVSQITQSLHFNCHSVLTVNYVACSNAAGSSDTM